jgi:hypothetical protein
LKLIAMRNLLLIAALILTISANASPTLLSFPVQSVQVSEEKTLGIQANPELDIANLSIKEFEKLNSVQLSFREKIGYRILQQQLKKEKIRNNEVTKSSKGQTALILGIAGLVALLIPVVIFASIPLAILAIVFGNQAKKENPNDRKGKTGALLGWITLGLFVIALFVVISVLNGFWG